MRHPDAGAGPRELEEVLGAHGERAGGLGTQAAQLEKSVHFLDMTFILSFKKFLRLECSFTIRS